MRCIAYIALIVTLPPFLHAQSGSDSSRAALLQYFTFEESSPFDCLVTYLPPLFIQNGIELKGFIRSKTFMSIRRQFGDIKAVDAIFVRAMRLTHNNTAMALLLATVCSFDHEIIGLRVPLLALAFPLTNEASVNFRKRIENLPTQLYNDTPHLPTGDRDKLQHFFGSSFLTFIFESRQPASRFGEFVEEGESAIVVGGTDDDRDRRANNQGQQFGMALLNDNHQLPSHFLRSSVVNESISTISNHCSGTW